MRLTARLQTIAAMTPAGAVLADIGTDHASLPVWLVKEGVIPGAIATDVAAGPCRAAQANVETAGLTDRIIVRRGDGLAAVSPGEADTVVIAGLGGRSIINILSASPAAACRIGTLITQPMSAARALRAWLIGHGWRIEREELAAEGEKLYEIILARLYTTTERVCYTDFEMEAGPLLLSGGHPLLAKHVSGIAEKYRRLCRSLAQSPRLADSDRYNSARAILNAAEEYLQCL